ncbi:MAG: mechanosensitive ion channel family protein, partial [Acidobacteriota bacterium]
VAYGADSDVVERALLEAADDLPGRIDAPAQALLQSFDDSGITWLLRVPIDDPWRLPQRTSALGRRVIDAFAQAGITIPFPQRDVHLQPAPDA